MIIYSQSLCKVWLNSLIIGSGYSGNGDGLNNPNLEHIIGHGPIPRGMWTIKKWTGEQTYIDNGGKSLGKQVAILEPMGFNPHNRSGFRWHGDNSAMNFTASDGCIVSPRVLRDHLALEFVRSQQSTLEVIG